MSPDAMFSFHNGLILLLCGLLSLIVPFSWAQQRSNKPDEFNCPEEFGYYPHPTDCTQYYVCVFGGALLESCTGGLMYSHDLQTCDWPRNVGCAISASETSTSSSSINNANGINNSPGNEELQNRYTTSPWKYEPLQQQSQTLKDRQQQAQQQEEIPDRHLYEEENLGPAEEVENDRQQRVYRGQPPTLGQVARDRDGIIRHANALQTSAGPEKIKPVAMLSFNSLHNSLSKGITTEPLNFEQYIEESTDKFEGKFERRRLQRDLTNRTYSSIYNSSVADGEISRSSYGSYALRYRPLNTVFPNSTENFTSNQFIMQNTSTTFPKYIQSTPLVKVLFSTTTPNSVSSFVNPAFANSINSPSLSFPSNIRRGSSLNQNKLHFTNIKNDNSGNLPSNALINSNQFQSGSSHINSYTNVNDSPLVVTDFSIVNVIPKTHQSTHLQPQPQTFPTMYESHGSSFRPQIYPHPLSYNADSISNLHSHPHSYNGHHINSYYGSVGSPSYAPFPSPHFYPPLFPPRIPFYSPPETSIVTLTYPQLNAPIEQPSSNIHEETPSLASTATTATTTNTTTPVTTTTIMTEITSAKPEALEIAQDTKAHSTHINGESNNGNNNEKQKVIDKDAFKMNEDNEDRGEDEPIIEDIDEDTDDEKEEEKEKEDDGKEKEEDKEEEKGEVDEEDDRSHEDIGMNSYETFAIGFPSSNQNQTLSDVNMKRGNHENTGNEYLEDINDDDDVDDNQNYEGENESTIDEKNEQDKKKNKFGENDKSEIETLFDDDDESTNQSKETSEEIKEGFQKHGLTHRNRLKQRHRKQFPIKEVSRLHSPNINNFQQQTQPVKVPLSFSSFYRRYLTDENENPLSNPDSDPNTSPIDLTALVTNSHTTASNKTITRSKMTSRVKKSVYPSETTYHQSQIRDDSLREEAKTGLRRRNDHIVTLQIYDKLPNVLVKRTRATKPIVGMSNRVVPLALLHSYKPANYSYPNHQARYRLYQPNTNINTFINGESTTKPIMGYNWLGKTNQISSFPSYRYQSPTTPVPQKHSTYTLKNTSPNFFLSTQCGVSQQCNNEDKEHENNKEKDNGYNYDDNNNAYDEEDEDIVVKDGRTKDRVLENNNPNFKENEEEYYDDYAGDYVNDDHLKEPLTKPIVPKPPSRLTNIDYEITTPMINFDDHIHESEGENEELKNDDNDSGSDDVANEEYDDYVDNGGKHKELDSVVERGQNDDNEAQKEVQPEQENQGGENEDDEEVEEERDDIADQEDSPSEYEEIETNEKNVKTIYERPYKLRIPRTHTELKSHRNAGAEDKLTTPHGKNKSSRNLTNKNSNHLFSYKSEESQQTTPLSISPSAMLHLSSTSKTAEVISPHQSLHKLTEITHSRATTPAFHTTLPISALQKLKLSREKFKPHSNKSKVVIAQKVTDNPLEFSSASSLLPPSSPFIPFTIASKSESHLDINHPLHLKMYTTYEEKTKQKIAQMETNKTNSNRNGYSKDHRPQKFSAPHRPPPVSAPTYIIEQSPSAVPSTSKSVYNVSKYEPYYNVYDDDQDVYRDIDYGNYQNERKTPNRFQQALQKPQHRLQPQQQTQILNNAPAYTNQDYRLQSELVDSQQPEKLISSRLYLDDSHVEVLTKPDRKSFVYFLPNPNSYVLNSPVVDYTNNNRHLKITSFFSLGNETFEQGQTNLPAGKLQNENVKNHELTFDDRDDSDSLTGETLQIPKVTPYLRKLPPNTSLANAIRTTSKITNSTPMAVTTITTTAAMTSITKATTPPPSLKVPTRTKFQSASTEPNNSDNFRIIVEPIAVYKTLVRNTYKVPTTTTSTLSINGYKFVQNSSEHSSKTFSKANPKHQFNVTFTHTPYPTITTSNDKSTITNVLSLSTDTNISNSTAPTVTDAVIDNDKSKVRRFYIARNDQSERKLPNAVTNAGSSSTEQKTVTKKNTNNRTSLRSHRNQQIDFTDQDDHESILRGKLRATTTARTTSTHRSNFVNGSDTVKEYDENEILYYDDYYDELDDFNDKQSENNDGDDANKNERDNENYIDSKVDVEYSTAPSALNAKQKSAKLVTKINNLRKTTLTSSTAGNLSFKSSFLFPNLPNQLSTTTSSKDAEVSTTRLHHLKVSNTQRCPPLCNEKPSVRGRNRGSVTYTTGGNEYDPVTSSVGGRTRPTLKPSTSIVSKSSETVDIYKHSPKRPDPVYPTPQVDKAAAKCRKDICLLPDCSCGGKDIPGDLSAEETPQIVLLTFDDSVNELNKGLYSDLFEKGRVNPNGCPISATFYVSHEWTDYSMVQNLYAAGHEIASHSVSHSFGEQFSQRKWTKEIVGQREILAAYGGVRQDDIRGMRAPFLAVGGNKMFKMLYDANFTYDSSMPIYENRPPSWPYTLDYKLFHDCMIPPCPTRSYPGVWEVPMVMWQDLNGGRCSMGDACSNPPNSDGVYKMLIKNFERHFTTNRAPFGLFYHSSWFTQPHHKEGFIAFLDTIVNMPEVWIITNWQAIQWARDPTPISRLNQFTPFNCDYPERPRRCNNPKVCNLWHKSGVRYLKTCQPCPDVYPWTGKTGVRNSRVDNDDTLTE